MKKNYALMTTLCIALLGIVGFTFLYAGSTSKDASERVTAGSSDSRNEYHCLFSDESGTTEESSFWKGSWDKASAKAECEKSSEGSSWMKCQSKSKCSKSKKEATPESEEVELR